VQDAGNGGKLLATDKVCQDLLYLQTPTTWLEDKVIGMSVVENGVLSDGPEDPADWPYKTVLEAIRDGWRVIQFPTLPPTGGSMDSHVFCEFILEKLT
jgi:hypothetical protein